MNQKEYYLKNREKRIEYQIQYYKRNIERLRKYNHEYYIKHRYNIIKKVDSPKIKPKKQIKQIQNNKSMSHKEKITTQNNFVDKISIVFD